MFIPFNMTQQTIEYIVRATGMKKVSNNETPRRYNNKQWRSNL